MNSVERAKLAFGVDSDAALSRALGVSTSVIVGYHKRDTVPLEQCIKIAQKTGVDLNWLIMGKGTAPDGTVTTNADDYLKIPVYDIDAAAGHGCHNEFEVIIDEIWLSPEWVHSQGLYAKNLYCVRVRGDSMATTLMPGDKVLINTAKVQGDGVFLLRIGGALRLKRLQWMVDGRIRLISDNPAYEPESINPSDMGEAFQILGHAHSKFGNLL